MRGEVLALVGAQYGSEAKGKIAQLLAHDFKYHVRTGGPNAGHTVYHNGTVHKMQVLPCGWVNPEAFLVIGRGAVVDIHQLANEINLVGKNVDSGIMSRVMRSEEHTSELQSQSNLVCRLLLEKKK